MNASATPIVGDLNLDNSPEGMIRNERTNDKNSEIFNKYKISMAERYMRPVNGTGINMMKTVIKFAADNEGEYVHSMPVFPVNKNSRILKTFIKIMRTLVNLGCLIHPAMDDVTVRRNFYDDLVSGKIYHFYKSKYYRMRTSHHRQVKRYLHEVCPSFVKWLIYKDGKKVQKSDKIVYPEGRFSSSELAVAAGGLGLATVMSVSGNQACVIAGIGGLTYLMNKYMELKKQQKFVNNIKTAVSTIKDNIIGMFKSCIDAISNIVSAILDVELTRSILIFHSIGILCWIISKYFSETSFVQRFLNVFNVETGDTVLPHGGGLSILALTALLSSVILPTFGLNVLKNYRTIKAIWVDTIGDKSIIDVLKTLVNYCCTSVGFEPFYVVLDELAEVEKLIEKFKKIKNSSDLQSRILSDDKFHRELILLRHEFNNHNRNVMVLREIPALVKTEFTRTISSLDKLIGQVSAANKQFINRMNPVTLWFSGLPGGGKSTMSKGVPAAVYKLLFDEKLKPTQTWTRNNSTEYDDGYVNQWHTDLPEMFQSRLQTSNEPQAFRYLMMCDTCIYPLNFSGVEDKGKHNFCSKIITSTTNDMNFTQTGIKSVSAILRRIMFPLEVYRGQTLTKADSLQELDKGWTFKLSSHAKKNLGDYKAIWHELLVDLNKSYCMSEVVQMVYNAYVMRANEMTPSDFIGNFDWNLGDLGLNSGSSESDDSSVEDDFFPDEDLSEEVVLETVPKGKEKDEEVVEPEGYFSDLKNWYYGTTEDDKEDIVFVSTKILKVLERIEDTVLAEVYLSRNQKTKLFTTHACLRIRYGKDKSILLENNQEEINPRFELSNGEWYHSCYTVKKSRILSALHTYASSKYCSTHSCHSFVQHIVGHEYVAPVLMDLDQRNKFVYAGEYSKIIKSAIYDPVWIDGQITGSELLSYLPKDSKNAEMPSLTYEYMTSTFKNGGVKRFFAQYWLGNLSVPEQGDDAEFPLLYLNNGKETRKNVSAEFLTELKTELSDTFRIGRHYYYVDLGKFNKPKTMVGRSLDVINKIANYFPSVQLESTWDGYYNLGKIASGVVLSALLVKYLPSFISACFELVKVRLFPEVKGESLHYNRAWTQRTVMPHGKFKNDAAVIAKYAAKTYKCFINYAYGREECHLLFLNSQVAATTQHTVSDLPNMLSLEIVMDGMDHGTKWDPIDLKIHNVEGREVSYIVFPRPLNRTKSIIKGFFSRDKIPDRFKEGLVLKTSTPVLGIATSLIKNDEPRGLYYRTKDGLEIRNVNDYYTTESCGYVAGDCGKPYLVSHEGNLKLLGIHYGSVRGDSYIAPIYKEDIPEVDDSLEFEHVYSESIVSFNDEGELQGLQYVGNLEKGIRGSTNTQLRTSPLLETEYGNDGLPPLDLYPASLYGPPVALAFKYYRGQRPNLHRYLRLRQVLEPNIFSKGFADPVNISYRPEFITQKQAILGDPEIGIASLDQTTSTGPSLSLGLLPRVSVKSSKRSAYFNKQTGWIDEGFMNHLMYVQEQHENATVIVPLVSETMKDELRGKAKIITIDGEEYVVPRAFANGDLSALIEHKCVFGDLMEHLKKHYSQSRDLVGINPYGFGWGVVFRKLRKFPNPFGLDVKGCDGSHTEEEAHDFFCWVNSTYYKFPKGSRLYNRLKCACYSLNSSDRIWKNGIYHSLGKNPSGCLLTCLMNGFFVYRLMSKSFYLLGYTNFGKDFDMRFEDEVVCFTFGDDVVASVSEEVASWFNRRSIIFTCKIHFDVVMTSPDKSEDPTSFDTFDTIDLLKRRFVKQKNVVMAPIEEPSILKSLYWCNGVPGIGSKQDYVDHYEQILKAAAHEYVMHGEERYNWFVSQFRKRFEAMGGIWNIPSYKAQYRFYRAQYNESIDYSV